MSQFKTVLWFSFLSLFFVGSFFATILFVQQPEIDLAARLDSAWQPKSGVEEITMIFTGDIMLGRYIKTLRQRNGGDFPFTYMPEVIQAVKAKLGVEDIDLVVGNLEGPVSGSNYVNPGTAMRFNFDPEVAELLKRKGFTTLSLANNHSYDQGLDAHTESIMHLENAGLDAFGYPDKTDGEHSFIHYQFGDTKVGFLGLNDAVYPLDKAAAIAKIRELDPLVDFLIIGIHWGVEYEPVARPAITEFAHQMVDNGADMIWGHHPHVVQNSEFYQGAPIYYSLGNFTFDQYWSSATQEGLVVGLKLSGGKVSTVEVMVDLVNKGEPRPR